MYHEVPLWLCQSYSKEANGGDSVVAGKWPTRTGHDLAYADGGIFVMLHLFLKM
jgi:hypothetical protein